VFIKWWWGERGGWGEGGQVRVEDIEAEPFRAVLRFLYTDCVEDHALDAMADHLLAAADKSPCTPRYWN
jgi:hypothetical protein